jgi:hypothetical protein
MVLGHDTWIELLGYAGAALTFGTYSMRRMIPLRVTGLCANCTFIVYAALAPVYPQLVLHSVLLPINLWRLIEMQRLTRRVATSAKGNLSMDWLTPFMTRRLAHAGQQIFAKGEDAEELYYVVSGRYRLSEAGIELGEGDLVGEIGLVAPGNRRMYSFVCIADGELMRIRYSRVIELYYQNPTFGFYLLQLISQRLLQHLNHDSPFGRAGGGGRSDPAADGSESHADT